MTLLIIRWTFLTGFFIQMIAVMWIVSAVNRIKRDQENVVKFIATWGNRTPELLKAIIDPTKGGEQARPFIPSSDLTMLITSMAENVANLTSQIEAFQLEQRSKKCGWGYYACCGGFAIALALSIWAIIKMAH